MSELHPFRVEIWHTVGDESVKLADLPGDADSFTIGSDAMRRIKQRHRVSLRTRLRVEKKEGPLVNQQSVDWPECPAAFKALMVQCRIFGLPLELHHDAVGYYLWGPQGIIVAEKEDDDRQLQILPLEGDRRSFDPRDEIQCAAALVNIGVAEIREAQQ